MHSKLLKPLKLFETLEKDPYVLTRISNWFVNSLLSPFWMNTGISWEYLPSLMIADHMGWVGAPSAQLVVTLPSPSRHGNVFAEWGGQPPQCVSSATMLERLCGCSVFWARQIRYRTEYHPLQRSLLYLSSSACGALKVHSLGIPSFYFQLVFPLFTYTSP